MKHLTILIHCPDRKGLVAAVTRFIETADGNITYLDQHVDHTEKIFFMRLECEFAQAHFDVGDFKRGFGKAFTEKYTMDHQVFDANDKLKMAVFTSKYDHCLYDLLGRHASGELEVEIPLIISNHPDLEVVAKRFDIPFKHIAVNRENKAQAEAEHLKLMKDHQVDLIVLARYMQILSDGFVGQFKNRIINIHHSFLPAFVGAKPYHAAFARGVKIIGATSHYVTAELDEGPIIEQEIVRVSHMNTVGDFIHKGRDLEKIVLARAITAHLAHKVLVYGNKTVIFS